MASALFVLVAYLIGSISFAVVVSWIFGLPDPHTYGSGNPGATNVLRTGKKAAAVLTLIGDAAKGAVALWLAQQYAPQFGLGEKTLAAVALAAFLGHLFPLYFHFRGGKGVATAAGILLAIDWRIALTLVVVWVLVVSDFALFVAGSDRRGGGISARGLLLSRLGADDLGGAGDRGSAGMAPPRQHRTAAFRQRKQDQAVETALSSSRSQRGRTANPVSAGAPAVRRSAPAKAIIAPLSVHRSCGG